MKLKHSLAAAAFALMAISSAILAAPKKPAGERKALLAHGKYIVDNVAMCGDCHTPRLPTGAPDMKHYLKGAELDFKPMHPMGEWESHAPDITSTGKARRGEARLADNLKNIKADAPMPNYRLNETDSKAVAAYLCSLK